VNTRAVGDTVDPVSVRFDVEAAVHQDNAAIAAWLFTPPRPIASPATVAVLLHGGTYDRRYWHPSVPGGNSYSAAAHLADMGLVVLALDHPGMGDSWRPADVELLTPRVAAKALHAAVNGAVEALGNGDLCGHIKPLPVGRVVGASATRWVRY
jgi:alpha-beta hydrolase superfamily lysophospholipase